MHERPGRQIQAGAAAHQPGVVGGNGGRSARSATDRPVPFQGRMRDHLPPAALRQWIRPYRLAGASMLHLLLPTWGDDDVRSVLGDRRSMLTANWTQETAIAIAAEAAFDASG